MTVTYNVFTPNTSVVDSNRSTEISKIWAEAAVRNVCREWQCHLQGRVGPFLKSHTALPPPLQLTSLPTSEFTAYVGAAPLGKGVREGSQPLPGSRTESGKLHPCKGSPSTREGSASHQLQLRFRYPNQEGVQQQSLRPGE